MTTFNEDMIAVALELIDEDPVVATIDTTVKSYSPTTGAVTGTPASTTINVSPPVPARTQYRENDTVLDSDCLVYGKADASIATVGRSITVTGRIYSVVIQDAFYAGEDVAAYALVLRG